MLERDFSGAMNILFNPMEGTINVSMTFNPLEAKDGGMYLCRAEPAQYTYTLTVDAAPPPVVITVVPNRDGPCGGVTTFTCSGSVVDNFVVSPDVTWQGPSNQTVGNQGVLSVQNGGSQIVEGMYTCMACVTVSSVGISNLCSTTTIQISYTTPGPVLGLTCPSLVSTGTLNITWSPPTDGGDVIVGYQVEVKRYVAGEGREVNTVDLTQPFNKEITSSSAVVTGLASTVRYLISVMGASASGCGSKVTVECYTEKGVPPVIQGVKVVRLSDSEMNVSWVPLTIVEANGFLGNYSITYSRVGGARRKRQAETVVEVSPDQSNVVIDGLEAGANYGVTVAARNLNTGTTSPPSPVVTVPQPASAPFQLRLTNINNCPEWVTVEQDGRISAISGTVVAEVESRCGCGFTSNNILEASFQCFPGSNDAVTYRAKLVETSSFSTSDLIDFISQWVSEDGIARVRLVLIRVDKSCQVAIPSFSDTECTSQPPTLPTGGGDTAVIGGVVGAIIALLIIAIAVVVIVITVLVLNSRRAKLKLQRDPKREFSPVTLHGMTSTGQIQPYEMVELGGHEYEDVTKYQQEGAEYEVITPDPLHTKHTHPPPLPSQAVETSPPPHAVSPSPPTQSPPTSPVTTASQPGVQGDYEFTECVAYKTTSHVRAPPIATPTDLEVVYSN